MISIDFKNSGAGSVTPPAVGMCSAADQVALKAPYAAPGQGTGLPFAGTTTPVRLRPLGAVAGVAGAIARPSVQTTVQTTVRREFAVIGLPVGQTSSTPGDLPPRDPLS